MRFSARLDTSHHGPPHPCKDGGVVADTLTGIHSATVVNRTSRCPHKGFESGVVLLYLSVGHDT
jgi:hypothetical protein